MEHVALLASASELEVMHLHDCMDALTLKSSCPAVLVPYLPIAPEVAAKKLHELYGMELLPWLSSGEAGCCADDCGSARVYSVSRTAQLHRRKQGTLPACPSQGCLLLGRAG